MAEDFISAQTLHKRLVAGGSSVGLSTVYRTLIALAEAGRADVFRDTNGERLFRHRPGPDHRHYLICTERGLPHHGQRRGRRRPSPPSTGACARRATSSRRCTCW
ncbi:transcriptional repressor [Streptomyces nondiastaticus]|uniref:transcriptional repressor n=1 Tax=Streptomyces nondiastaticus TaxID=3154512 RepID=UPI0034391776